MLSGDSYVEHLFPLHLFSFFPDGYSCLFSCHQPDPSWLCQGYYSITLPLCRKQVLSKTAFSEAETAIVSKTIPAKHFAAGWLLPAAGWEGGLGTGGKLGPLLQEGRGSRSSSMQWCSLQDAFPTMGMYLKSATKPWLASPGTPECFCGREKGKAVGSTGKVGFVGQYFPDCSSRER